MPRRVSSLQDLQKSTSRNLVYSQCDANKYPSLAAFYIAADLPK